MYASAMTAVKHSCEATYVVREEVEKTYILILDVYPNIARRKNAVREARTLTEQRNTHPHEIPILRPPGEGQLRNRTHNQRFRSEHVTEKDGSPA